MNRNLLLFVLFIFLTCLGKTYSQGTDCSNADPFCTDSGATFPAGVNNGDFQPCCNDYGCLITQPNGAWYYLEISTGGDLNIDLTSSPPEDIDFALWGPFSNLANAQGQCGSLPAPLDCSFSPATTEQANIVGALAGEVYMLLITNYSNNTTDITAQLTNNSTGATDCSIVTPPPCSADAGTITATETGGGSGNNLIICDGESASLISNDDYILPPPFPGEESELMYAVYNCAPPPSPDPDNDVCFGGIFWTGEDFDLANAGAFAQNNGGFPQAWIDIGITGTNGTIWLVPITADDSDNAGNPNGVINIDQDGDGCWDAGTPISITFPEIASIQVTTICNPNNGTGSIDVLVNGSGNYTITETGDGNVQGNPGTVTNGDIFTITGLNNGDVWSFTLDDNGCATPFTGTFVCDDGICLVNGGITYSPPASSFPGGLYPPNTTVTFCIDIGQYNQSNVNFLHGIVPTYGNGWTNIQEVTTPAVAANNENGSYWQWDAPNTVIINSSGVSIPWDGWWFYSVNSPGGAPADTDNSWGDGCTAFCYPNMTQAQCEALNTAQGVTSFVWIDGCGCANDDFDIFGCNWGLWVGPWVGSDYIDLGMTQAICESLNGIWNDPAGPPATVDQYCEFCGTCFGNPATGFGLSWDACFSLTTVDQASCESGNNDLTVSVITYADGVTGIWTDPGCLNDDPIDAPTEDMCCIPDPSASGSGFCEGSPVILSGSGSGSGVLTWYSDPVGGTAVGTGPSLNLGNLPEGTYTYYLEEDNNGCTSNRISIVFTVDPLPTLTNVSGNQIICNNNPTPVTLTVSGTNYNSISWSPGGGSGTSISVNPGSTTIYTATATNSCGTDDVPFVVSVVPPSSANISGIDDLCGDGMGDLTITLVGIAPWDVTYTIDGSNATTISINTSDVIDNMDGTYTYTLSSSLVGAYAITNISDGSGCSDSGTGSGVINPCCIPPVINNPGPQFICSSYTLPPISGSNLTGNENYYDDSQANGGAILTGPILTTTTVWIYDGIVGCSDEVSFLVTIYTPAPDIIITYIGCIGDGYSYIGPNNIIYNEGNPTENTVLQDANGCDYNLVVNMTFNSVSASSSVIDVDCNGASTGSIDLTISSGTAPFSFVWDNGAAPVEDPSGLPAGTYNVTITDSNPNPCTATYSITINEPAEMLATACSGTNVTCFGSSDGEATVISSGGTSPYTYAWPGGGSSDTETGLAAGTYIVTVTDNNLCTETCEVIITEPAALTGNMFGPNFACPGDSPSLEFFFSGGTGPYNITYSGTSTTVSNGGSIPVSAPGSYSFDSATDADGCSINVNGSVIIVLGPNTTIDNNTLSGVDCTSGTTNCDVCLGSSITISANGTNLPDGSSIEWFYSTDQNFDPCSGQGTSIGTALITTPPLSACSPCPEILGIMIDACGSTESDNEMAILHSGGGFNTDNFEFDYDSNNNNFGSQNHDIVSGSCGIQTPTSTLMSNLQSSANCDITNVIPAGPNTDIPEDAIVLFYPSSGATEVYDIDQLCQGYQTIYVIQSSCDRSSGAFSNYDATSCGNGNDGTRTQSLSINGCACTDSWTYDRCNMSQSASPTEGVMLVDDGNGNMTFIQSDCSIPFPQYQSVTSNPSTIADLDFTTTLDMCNGGPYYVSGILNPAPATACINCLITPIVTEFNVICPDVTITPDPATFCEGTTVTLTASGIDGVIPYSYDWSNGSTNTSSIDVSVQGVYTVTVTDNTGCTDTYDVTVSENPNSMGTEDYTGCQGDGYTVNVNGNTYNEGNPAGTETLTSFNNCDSVVTINLVYNNATTGTEDYIGCQGDGYSISVNGNTYDEGNPAGSETLTAFNNCDSVVTINLVYNIATTGTEDYTGCQGDGYTVNVNGNTYDEGNPAGTETLTDFNNCDSVVTINLVYNNATTGTEDYTGCQGDGYTVNVNGNTYNEGNPAGTETLTSFNNCDSVVTINLVYNNATTGTEDYIGCQGDGYSISVNGNTYDEGNPAGSETLTAFNNCDSVVTINLVYNIATTGTEDYTGCQGDGYAVNVNGNTYNEGNPAGTETLTAFNNCDSVVTINLVYNIATTGTEDYTGCQGDGYTVNVNGNTYDEGNPAGTETLTDFNNCDSVVTINLVYNIATTGTEDYTGCQGDGYTVNVNGNTYNEGNPAGTETLTAFNNCDSVVTINLVYNNATTGTEDYTGCQGDGYTVNVNGNSYDEGNPAGTETLTGFNNCDSVVTINLVYNIATTGTEDYTGCQGDGYTVNVNGNTYDEGNPAGTETLTGFNNCDSIVTINLVYNNATTGTEDYNGCQGDGYTVNVNGNTYDEGNPAGTETLTGFNNCDSVVTVNLVYNNATTGTEDYTGCQSDGYSVTVNGTLYFEGNPAGTETLTAFNNCDSVVTINLVYNNATTGTEDYTGCQGDGYTVNVNGNTYDEGNPAGTETLTAFNNCDSVVTINLVYNIATTGTEDYTGCQGDGYTVNVNGNTYDEGNPAGTETLTGFNNCDSIVTINLVYNNATTGTEDYNGCQGDGYTVNVNGNTYDEGNPAGTETLTGFNNCDSVVTINLVYNIATTGTEDYTGCQGDGYTVNVNGNTYNEGNPAGTETLTGFNNCDSVVTINLVYNNATTGTEDYTGCQGDGYTVNVNGNTYDEGNPAGTETLTGFNNCDSVVTVNLVYNNATTGTEDYNGCQSDGYSVNVNGNTYNEGNPAGTETLTGFNNCDSIVTINLVYNIATTGTEDYTGCQGDGYTVNVNGNTYDEGNPAGTETLTDFNNCDSVVTINLVYNIATTGTEDYTGCQGDGYTVNVNGNTYNEGNPAGTETLTAFNNCDSIVTINLVYNIATTGTEDYTGCQGDGYSISVNGNTYDEGNPAGSETLTGFNNCDSVVTINLVYNIATTGTEDYTGCQGDGYTVNVNGNSYDEGNPAGTETLTGFNNCDSIVTINLVYNIATTGTEDYTGCQGDGYTVNVNGNTYDEGNPAGTETLTDFNNCDSVVTINLVYNIATTGTEDYTGCQGDGYTVNVNGNTYNEGNPAGTETLTAFNNCDSVVTINLVYNNATTGTEDYTGCQGDGYSISVNGNTYDEGNPAGSETLTGFNNCDSVVTINLVYNIATTGTEDYTGCQSDGYSVNVNGNTYDEGNPAGTETLTGFNNCDSIVTINLVYNNATTGTEDYNGCQGDGYTVNVNGNTYDEGNPAGTETLTGFNNCDSVVTVNLVYNNATTGTEDYNGCQSDGYSVTVNGTLYFEGNPAGTETLTAFNNCDSVVTINLVYNNTTTGTEDYNGCQSDGYSVTVNGNSYNEGNPAGTETLTGFNNCDSVVTINLVYNNATTGTEDYTGCQSDGYSVNVNGNTYDEGNPAGTETLTGFNNCDSIVTINLVYNNATTGTEDYNGCQGDGYTVNVNGNTYDEGNPTGTETLIGFNNCDSVVTVNLVYNNATTGTEDYTGCQSDGYSVTVNGTLYFEGNPAGTETLTAFNNCDSVVTINLVYNNTTTGTEDYNGCQGDGYSVTVNGNSYNEGNPAGTETLTGFNNCDSVVTINLVYNNATTGTEDYTGCQSDGYSVNVNGNTYDEGNPAGTETLTGFNNCDSIVTINLVYNNATTGTEDYNGCQGDGYTVNVNGNTYDEGNPTGTETLIGFNNCDSVVTVNLVYNNATTGTEDYTGCQSDGYSVTVNGTLYFEGNPAGTETLTGFNNCDSVVTINLVYNNTTTGTEDYNGCQGDGYSVTVNGNSYNEGNPAGTETLTGFNNCDSIVTINLVYNIATTGTEDYTGCQSDGYSVNVNGNTYDEGNPAGTETLTGFNNCDSIVTINLVYNNATTGTEDYNGCQGDGYTVNVNGNTYDEGNPAGTETLTGFNNCDSVVTVNLIYNNATTGTEDYNGCQSDGYSVTVNGTLYFEGNPAGTETLTGFNNCDSVVTINLVYNNTTTGTEDYNGCQGDGYTVNVNGNSYNEGNPAGTETLTGFNNCDSIVTINLVYNIATTGTEDYTGCQSDGYSVNVNGNTYDEGNPAGTETLTGFNNCDSVVTINLVYNIATTGTEDYIGCQDDGYTVTVNGNTYDEGNPTGTETLIGFNNCDSVVTIALVYYDPTTGTESYTGCQSDGYSVTVNGTLYFEGNPVGTETLTGFNNCDSVVTINLVYNIATTGTEDYNGCQGDGYTVTVNGNSYNEGNPAGTETLTGFNNCDSIVTINLVYNNATTGTEDYNGCQSDGYSVTVNGTLYFEGNPVGTETLTGFNNCDSVVTINLVYNIATTGTEDYIGCQDDGYTVTVNGNTYDEGNPTGTETLIGFNNCDSVVTIALVYYDPTTGTESYTGCQSDGYSVTVNGTLYFEGNPVGTETLTGFNNCDSVVTINLVYNIATTGTEDYIGCQDDGYTVTVNGNTYDEGNPTGTETLIGFNNCDSVVTIALVYYDPTTGTESYTGCQSDGYSVTVNGTLYFEGNPAGTETLTGFNNCDSVVTINLVYNNATTGTEDYTGCQDDGYTVTVNGNTYDEGNPAGTETLTGFNNCDSVVTVNLVYNNATTGTEDYTGCQNDGYSVIVNGTLYDESNPTGVQTLDNSQGCDSTVVISLTFNTSNTGSESYNGCNGDGYSVIVNGNTYDEGNPTGTEILTNALGCDSTVSINLVFGTEVFGMENYEGCNDDGYSVIVNGNVYDEANPSGSETLTSINGCDSIVTISLSFNANLTGEELYTGCEGDGYNVLVNGNLYDESAPTGTEILTSSIGCDSIVSINLLYNPPTTGEEQYSGCEGDGYAVLVNNVVYNESNPSGVEVLISSDGCDSTVTITLTYNESVSGEELYSGCEGDGYSVIVNGNTYNEGNPIGSETLTSNNGCDSVVTIALIYNTELNGQELYTGCEGDGYNVIVDGNLYDENNPTGIDTIMSSVGCDSIVTISLSFNTNLTGEELYTGCEGDGYAVTVNGNLYDESAPTGTEILTSSIGCDSIVSINLFYNPATTGEELYSGCEGDGYTVVVNSIIFNEATPSGVQVISNSAGCDSTVVINLQFNPASAGTESYTGCTGDGYNVIVNGNTYDESNPTGTEILSNALGCDSTVSINLAFSTEVFGMENYEGCNDDGYSVIVNGNVYDEANPTGSETLTSINGCDSIVTISLSFNANLTGQELYTGCEGDGYAVLVNGNLYDESAPTGTEILPSSIGCDSIVSINLLYNPATSGEELYSGCQGDGYTVVVNSIIFNEATPSGVQVISNSAGCDSTVVINLQFNPASAGTESYTGCTGDGYNVIVNGNTYDESNPTGTEILSNALGCDSTVSINLAFSTEVFGMENYEGCNDDGYSVIVNGNVYDEANPSGSETLTSINGCDSIVTISLSFNANLTGEELYTGCEGDGYAVLVNGNLYDESAPTGTEILPSSIGCDSIVSINLLYNPATSGEELYSGCQGDGYTVVVNSIIYNEATPSGVQVISNSAGCDSTVVINLQFNPASAGTENYTGCIGDGYSVLVNGTTYDESNPTGSEILTNALGCDSTVIINLAFSNEVFGTENYEGCNDDGYSVIVNGNVYDEANPTGSETLTSINGCDSIVTISLSFNANLTGEELYTGCEGDGYAVTVNGNIYDESAPTGTETLASSIGCDSIVSINLFYNPATTGEELYSGCEGDGYTVVVNSIIFNEATPSGVQVISNSAGCDSTVVINLQFSPATAGAESYTGCTGDGYSVLVNGTTYDESNPTGSEILTNALGCDSTVTINLAFSNEVFGTENYEGCNDDGYSVIVNGNVYDEANPTGSETLTSINGCDSIVTISLSFNANLTGEELYTGCEGDGYTVTVNGNIYDESAPIGTETLASSIGCDSIVSINLLYNPATTGEELYSGCEGDGYTVVVNSIIFNEATPSGVQVISNSAGCDSTVVINLQFNPASAGTENYTGCIGDGYSVIVNGNTYDESNPTGTETLTNALGCDSTVSINLAFSTEVFGTENYEGCNDDGYSITVNGNVYDEGNPTGTETLTSTNGCDSIVTISLSFNANLTGEELYTGCEGDGYAVTVNGNIYDESAPIGTETLPSSIGCDSIVSINLLYNPATTGEELYSGCEGDGYTVVVNSIIYNEATPSGVQVISNSAGCDSTVVINLQFNPASAGTENYTGCIGDGYSVIVNGNTYDEGNPTGTETLTNALGCDSTVSINLAFSTEVFGTENYEGCNDDGYSITVNGNVYDEGNPTGTETLTSTNGCDSIVTISLSFNANLTGEELYTGCEGDGYAVLVNGNLYDESAPIGTETLASSIGCDSIVSINLLYNVATTGEELYNGCEGDGYVILVNGVVYNETNSSGVEILTSSTGCDSTVTIQLNFTDGYTVDELYDGCEGDGYSVTVNGNVYDEGNPSGTEILTSTAGCDSTVTIQLNFTDGYTVDELYDGCEGDGYSVTVNGNVYDEGNPSGTEILTSTTGCDSTVTIQLNFTDGYTVDELYDGCEGDGYFVTVNGNVYDEGNPSGTEILTSTTGCDSTVTIQLNFTDGYTVDELYDGCEGDGYSVTVNGNVYDEGNPSGTEILTSTTGCDSTVTIQLNFTDGYTVDELYDGCEGDGYTVTVNGTVYNQNNPSGVEILTSTTGCDSTVTIQLNFADGFAVDELYDGCEGDGYSVTVNGNVYDEGNPSGTEILTSTTGCDSTVTIQLNFTDGYTVDELYDGCEGDGYTVTVNGTVYNQNNPSGVEILTSTTGCDSTVTIQLNFADGFAVDELYDGCEGDGYTVTVNGTVYDQNNPSGTEILTSTTGCDSTVTIQLNFADGFAVDELYDGCEGDGYTVTVNGTVYDQNNPSGTEILTSTTGCDSTVTIQLNFADGFAVDELYDGCEGDGYTVTVNGTVYDQNNPSGTEILTSTTGCDSTITIDLVFNLISNGFETYAGCIGDGYSVVVNGAMYDESNPSGVETLVNSIGCDSIVNINLAYNTSSTSEELYTGCEGDGYFVVVNNVIYDEGNPSGVETLTNASGCDSTINILLDYLSEAESLIDPTLCFGQSLTVNGTVYNESSPTGVEIIVGGSASGCDSLITIDLSFANSVTFNLNDLICENESISVNGTTYDQNNPSGTEILIGGSAGGCDSIVNVNLEFIAIPTFMLDPTLCFGQSISVNGTIYDEANPIGSEVLTDASYTGCDSIVNVSLNFEAEVQFDLSPTLCPGEEVQVNGNIYDESTPAGTETIVGGSYTGCDSTIFVDLSFFEIAESTFDPTLCPGESVQINGNQYDEFNLTGTEIIAGSSYTGCDSTVFVDLSFEEEVISGLDPSLCPGENAIVNGTTYDASNPIGTEIIIGGSYTGCDSTVNINLSFYPPSESIVDPTLCIGESLTINNNVYDESNPTGTETLEGASYTGCDSTVIISLNFAVEATFDLVQTLCEDESIVVNGTEYGLSNPTGVEILEGASYLGCDSTIFVNLDFHPFIGASLTEDAFICPGDSIAITFLFDGASLFDVEYSAGGTIMTLTGISSGYTIMVSPSVTTIYSILAVTAQSVPCDAILGVSDVTISVNDINVTAEVTTDFEGFGVSCNGGSDGEALATGTGGQAPYTYNWSTGQTGNSLSDLTAGVYMVTATDANGCTAIDQVALTEPPSAQVFMMATLPTCYGDNDGTIVIDTIIGGTAPYEFSIDGEFYQQIGSFPHTISFLEAGNYDVSIFDVNDCNTVNSISVPEPLPPLVEIIASEEQIILGDSVRLQAITNLDNPEVTWITSELLSCDTCLITYSSPQYTTQYGVQVIDEQGCIATDEITISVFKPRDVYIPNAFSPNGDGINDVFFVNAGQEVLEIKTMRIFDRWGEVVFQDDNFPPNDPSFGWDGTFRGETMNPSVFVYLVEIEFIDGWVELYKGDVTLIK